MTALALPCLGDQLDDVRRNASVLVLAAVGYGRASCVPASPVPQRWLDGPVRGVRRVPQRGKPEGMTWWKEKPAADSNDEQCDVEAVCGSEERVVDDVWDGGDGSTERQMRFGHCRVTRQPITERESDNCGTEADWPGAGRVHPKPHPPLSSLLLAMSSTKVKKAAKPPAMSMQGMSRSFHLSTTHILTVLFPASQRSSRRTRNYSLISRIWLARLES